MPFKKRYFFRKIFLLITILVFALLFVLTSILELISLHNQEEKIQVDMQNRANGIVSSLEQEITDYIYFSDKLKDSSWMRHFMSDSEILSAQISPFRKTEIAADMNLYSTLFSKADSIGILFPTKNQAVSSEGWLSINDYLSTVHISTNQKEEILNIISSADANHVIGILNGNDDLYKSGLLFIRRIDTTTKARAKVAMFVSERNLMSLFSQEEMNMLEEISFSQNNQVIYQLSGTAGGNKTCHYHYFFPSMNLQCNIVLSMQSNNAAITGMIITSIFFASILLATCISWILSVKLYSPIQKLMDDIGLKTENVENEVWEISKIFSNLTEVSKNNEMQLQKYLLFARTHYLQRILWDEYNEENLHDRLTEYSIPFEDDMYYAVLLVHIAEKSIVKRADMVRRVRDRLKELNLLSEWIENRENECYVIVYHKELSQLETSLKKLEWNLSLMEEDGDSVDVLFSKCSMGIQNLPKLHNEVTLEFSLRSNVLANLERRKQFFFTSEQQEKLSRDVHAGNYRNVENTLAMLKSENLRLYETDTSLRYLAVYMLNLCRQLGTEMSIASSEIDDTITQAISSVDGHSCYTEVCKVFRLLCEERSKRYDQLVPETAKAIREYTEEHFCEYNLSQQAVAARFELTPSSLSKLFKAAYGITYLDYLRTLRIDRAKKMIKEGENDLRKIARAVGYESDLTFKRAFQKCDNVSPHDYLSSKKNK